MKPLAAIFAAIAVFYSSPAISQVANPDANFAEFYKTIAESKPYYRDFLMRAFYGNPDVFYDVGRSYCKAKSAGLSDKKIIEILYTGLGVQNQTEEQQGYSQSFMSTLIVASIWSYCPQFRDGK